MWLRLAPYILGALLLGYTHYKAVGFGQDLEKANTLEAQNKALAAEAQADEERRKYLALKEKNTRATISSTRQSNQSNEQRVSQHVEAHPKPDVCRLDADDVRLLSELVTQSNEERR